MLLGTGTTLRGVEQMVLRLSVVAGVVALTLAVPLPAATAAEADPPGDSTSAGTGAVPDALAGSWSTPSSLPPDWVERDWTGMFSAGEVRVGPPLVGASGDEGRIHAVEGFPDLVIKVMKEQGRHTRDSWEARLLAESAALDQLAGYGIPNIMDHRVVDWTDPSGGQREVGLLMPRIDGIASAEMFQLSPEHRAALGVGQRTVDDLQSIQEIVERESLYIGDFQGLIDRSSGAFITIDPRGAEVVATESPQYVHMMDYLLVHIQAAQEAAAATPSSWPAPLLGEPSWPVVDPDETQPSPEWLAEQLLQHQDLSLEAGGPQDAPGSEGPDAEGTGSSGGVVVSPELEPGSLEDLLDQTFPGGDPATGPDEPDLPADTGHEGEPGADTLEWWLEEFPGAQPSPPQLPEDFVPVPGLEELLYPNGPAGPRFTFPVGPEEVPGAETTPPAVDTALLQQEMRRWQDGLQRDGVVAHRAAEVFNHHQDELRARFGLSPQQATELLGGTYSPGFGQRLVGPAIVGPAIVGPAIVGPAIVGPAIVGPAVVGPCTRGMACWGNGPAGIGAAGTGESPLARQPGGAVPPVPQPQQGRSPVVRTAPPVTAPSPTAPPQQGAPVWEQVGRTAMEVLTYPHPLDPVRGAWRDVWRYLPVFGPGGQREPAF